MKKTLYSGTEINLRAVITTSSACDSTQHLHKAVRAKKWEQRKVFSQEGEKICGRARLVKAYAIALALDEALDIHQAVYF